MLFPEDSAMAEAMLAHVVYFTLKDNSTPAIRRQLELCKEHLTEHPGTVYFSVGTRTRGLNRDVNDKEFDVALHVVFKNRAAHDQYQTDPRHLKFIEASKPNWAKARVFDADVE
jgi:quinol monooxygenase YgiN